jgi:hypothetical protein
MITTLKIKPMGGVAALFVNRFEKRDLGGFAAEALGVCIVTSLGDPVLGKTLAHEFGHLLSLSRTCVMIPRRSQIITT